MHASLESKQDFSDWVKNRVEQCYLVKNQDYGVCSINLRSKECGVESRKRGGHNAIEYWATLDAAKEIALMEGTAKGKEMRRYFIECEKRLRAILVAQAVPDLQNPDVLLRLVNQYSGELLESMEKAKFNEEEATPISPPSGLRPNGCFRILAQTQIPRKNHLHKITDTLSWTVSVVSTEADPLTQTNNSWGCMGSRLPGFQPMSFVTCLLTYF